MKTQQFGRQFDSHPLLDRFGLSGYKREFFRWRVLLSLMRRYGMPGLVSFIRHASNIRYACCERVTSPIPLIRVCLEPTLRCNLSCSTCSRASLPSRDGAMSFEEFRRMVQRIPGLSYVHMSGLGETLMNPDIPEMIKYLDDRGIHATIITNGTLLSEELGRALLRKNVDTIGISIDSFNPATYQLLRGANVLHQVLENCKRLDCLRKRMRSVTRIEITSVVRRNGFFEMPAIIDAARQIGADGVRFKLAECWDQPENADPVTFPEVLSSAEFRETSKKAKARNFSMRVSAEIDEHEYRDLFQHKRYQCESPWYECNILHNGDVVPCLMGKRLQRNYVCGNIFRQTFETIWNGERFQLLRRQILQGDRPDFCRFCSRLVYKG